MKAKKDEQDREIADRNEEAALKKKIEEQLTAVNAPFRRMTCKK